MSELEKKCRECGNTITAKKDLFFSSGICEDCAFEKTLRKFKLDGQKVEFT